MIQQALPLRFVTLGEISDASIACCRHGISFRMVYGTCDRKNDETQRTTHVKLVHPKYQGSDGANDIALLYTNMGVMLGGSSRRNWL